MRRPLVFVLAWTAATVVAVVGSWVGLQPVLAAAAPELPTRLTAAQLREAAPIVVSPTDPVSQPPTEPAPPPSPSPSPPPSPTPPPVEPSAGAPFPDQPPTSSDWAQLEGRNTFERTFILRGGEVVVRANRREVEVLSHTANPGYEASVTRWSRSSVIVTFQTAEEEVSRLWVMWRDGPYAEVTETV